MKIMFPEFRTILSLSNMAAMAADEISKGNS